MYEVFADYLFTFIFFWIKAFKESWKLKVNCNLPYEKEYFFYRLRLKESSLLLIVCFYVNGRPINISKVFWKIKLQKEFSLFVPGYFMGKHWKSNETMNIYMFTCHQSLFNLAFLSILHLSLRLTSPFFILQERISYNNPSSKSSSVSVVHTGHTKCKLINRKKWIKLVSWKHLCSQIRYKKSI